jgi:NAD(P)H dehydrogenase (quinone)
MLLVGLPYSDPSLMNTSGGGTPYGASHLSGPEAERPLDDDESRLCRTLGKRVAQAAVRLSAD